jgi:hypothetical protein
MRHKGSSAGMVTFSRQVTSVVLIVDFIDPAPVPTAALTIFWTFSIFFISAMPDGYYFYEVKNANNNNL